MMTAAKIPTTDWLTADNSIITTTKAENINLEILELLITDNKFSKQKHKSSHKKHKSSHKKHKSSHKKHKSSHKKHEISSTINSDGILQNTGDFLYNDLVLDYENDDVLLFLKKKQELIKYSILFTIGDKPSEYIKLKLLASSFLTKKYSNVANNTSYIALNKTILLLQKFLKYDYFLNLFLIVSWNSYIYNMEFKSSATFKNNITTFKLLSDYSFSSADYFFDTKSTIDNKNLYNINTNHSFIKNIFFFKLNFFSFILFECILSEKYYFLQHVTTLYLSKFRGYQGYESIPCFKNFSNFRVFKFILEFNSVNNTIKLFSKSLEVPYIRQFNIPSIYPYINRFSIRADIIIQKLLLLFSSNIYYYLCAIFKNYKLPNKSNEFANDKYFIGLESTAVQMSTTLYGFLVESSKTKRNLNSASDFLDTTIIETAKAVSMKWKKYSLFNQTLSTDEISSGITPVLNTYADFVSIAESFSNKLRSVDMFTKFSSLLEKDLNFKNIAAEAVRSNTAIPVTSISTYAVITTSDFNNNYEVLFFTIFCRFISYKELRKFFRISFFVRREPFYKKYKFLYYF